jgi:hypothetical protein
MRKLPDLGLVIIDNASSSMHGDENMSVVVQQWSNEAVRVCGELGAAVLVLHHPKKEGKDPIITAEDMHREIRGSGAMTNGLRAALGIWPVHDYVDAMRGMGLEPQARQLYRMAVTKANGEGMLKETRTLLRDSRGLLVDVTADAVRETRSTHSDARLWLIAAVEHAASVDHPYPLGEHGLEERATELPPAVAGLSRRGRKALIESAIEDGAIVVARGRGWTALDVPGGPWATGERTVRALGAYPRPAWHTMRVDPRTLDVVAG